MATLIVQNHLQANPWADSKQGRCFSCNWTVAHQGLDGKPDEVMPFLLPWLWDGFSLKVLVQKQGKGEFKNSAFTIAEEKVALPKWVDGRLKPFFPKTSDFANFLKAFETQDQETKVVVKIDSSSSHQNLTAAMMELSRLPQPVPHLLKISTVFWVDKLVPGDLLIAFPEPKVGPSLLQFEKTEVDKVTHKVLYKVPPKLPIEKAHCRTLAVQIEKNTKSQWQPLEPDHQISYFHNGDYQSKLAALFDLPRRAHEIVPKLELETDCALAYLSLTELHFQSEFRFLKNLQPLGQLFKNDPPSGLLEKKDGAVKSPLLVDNLIKEGNSIYLAYRAKVVAALRLANPKQDLELTDHLKRWPWNTGFIGSLAIQKKVKAFLANPKVQPETWKIGKQDFGALSIPGSADKLEKRLLDELSLLQAPPVTTWKALPPGLPFRLTLPKPDGPSTALVSYAILMREEGKTWRCLHLVDLNPSESLLCFRPSLTSLTKDKDGNDQWLLSYNNRPLSLAGPDSNSLNYSNAYKNGRSLPRLCFGNKYQAVAFPVGPAGVIPFPLMTPAAASTAPVPWRLAGDAELKLPADAPEATPLEYLRPVGVGPVRWVSKDNKELQLPAIPASVHPLARSLREAQTEFLQSAPLALLNQEASMKLELLTPSCGDLCWEQCIEWKAEDKGKPWQLPFKVFKEKFKKFHASIAGKSVELLADPYVTQVKICLVSYFPDPLNVGDPICLPLKEGEPVTLDIAWTTGDIQFKKSDTDKVGLQINLPQGGVWSLEAYPVVHEDVLKRFEGNLKLEHSDFDQDGAFLPARSAMLLETVTSLMPSGDQLHSSLEVFIDPERRRLVAQVTDYVGLAFHFIHQLSLLTQRWNWTGRPISGDHCRDLSLDSDQWPRLEARLFGDRDASDYRLDARHIDFAAILSAQDSTDPIVLQERDLSQETACLVYRTALRAHSRYEGLLSAQTVSDSRLEDANSFQQSSFELSRWKPVILPAQEVNPLASPRVQLIVPLTSASDSEFAGPAPLLVVLQEPWFGLGGVAEVLDCQIHQILDPKDKKLVNQWGPDPLLVMEATLNSEEVALRVEGPIGHTFDEEATLAPLFRRVSFVVHPPKHPQVSDLSWYFLQLKFRRAIMQQGFREREGDLVSAWTQPIWCQLLPANNRWGETGEARIEAKMKGQVLTFHKEGKLVPVPSSKDMFQWWALLTRDQFSAGGRQDIESFVKLVKVGQPISPPPSSGCLVRLVEVQFQTDPPEEKEFLKRELWDWLFPSEESAEPVARIVRVSPKIPIQIQS